MIRCLQWKDAPKGYGPHKTLYNRFVRWSALTDDAHTFILAICLAAAAILWL